MRGNYQVLAYLMAVNMETVVLMLAGWWAAGWLNEHFHKDFNWMVVTFPIAALLVLHSWFVLFRTVLNTKSELPDDSMRKK